MAKLKPGYAVSEEGHVVDLGQAAARVEPRCCSTCGGAVGSGRTICRPCEIRYAPPEPAAEPVKPAPAPRPARVVPPKPAVLPIAEQLTEAEEATLETLLVTLPASELEMDWEKSTPATPIVVEGCSQVAEPPAAKRRTGGEKLVSVTTALPPASRDRLVAVAELRGLKVGALLRQVIEEWLSAPC